MPRKNATTKVKKAAEALETATTPAGRQYAMEKLHAATDELNAMAKEAKKRYNDMDAQTRKKVVAGVAGAAALLAAAIGAGAVKKRKTKK